MRTVAQPVGLGQLADGQPTSRDATSGRSIALVHDWLTVPGGSEDVFEEICKLFPGTVFTSQWDRRRMSFLEGREVRTSWVQRLPWALTNHYIYAPLLAFVYPRFNLEEFDVVVSDSHSFAHGVRKRRGAVHINYYHTPARSLWLPEIDGRASGLFRNLVAGYLKKLDLKASRNPDVVFANSQTTAARVKRYYGREVRDVIHPPVATARFLDVSRKADDEGFLIWGRLIPYKRVDLAIEAAKRMGFKLNVVGTGTSERRLRDLANGEGNIVFHGRIPDDRLKVLMSRSRAVIFPSYEDFGLVPVEAMAAGLPVVAFGKGGACETLTEETSVLFTEQTPEALCGAVEELSGRAFDVSMLRARAALFDVEVFRRKFGLAVEEAVAEHFKK